MSKNKIYKIIIKEVENLNKLQMFEIYKIMKKYVIEKDFTINTSGVFVLMTNLPDKCIKEILKFIEFIKDKNKDLEKREKDRDEIIEEFKKYKKKNTKIPKKVIKKVKKDIKLKGSHINLNKKKEKQIKGNINSKIIKNFKNNKKNKIDTTTNIVYSSESESELESESEIIDSESDMEIEN